MTDPQAERGITPPKKPMPGGFSLEHFVEGTKPEDIEALAQALDRDEPDLSAQPAPLVPPEPKESSFFFSTSRTFNSPEYEAALKTWGRQCAEIAQAQARRVDEVEALWHESNASYYDVLAERDEARSTLAQRDREVLELREALRYCSNQSCGPDWTPEQALVYIKEEARNALASTAQAGAEAERRIREDERGKIEDRVFNSEFADHTGPRQDAILRAAILGTGGEAVDLSKCPKCGGPADNGHDRCLPPNPYFCSECSGDAR